MISSASKLINTPRSSPITACSSFFSTSANIRAKNFSKCISNPWNRWGEISETRWGSTWTEVEECLMKPGLSIGIALSGGPDSMGLASAAVAWAKSSLSPLRTTVHGVVVDHGIRVNAAAETEAVMISGIEDLGLDSVTKVTVPSTWWSEFVGKRPNQARMSIMRSLAISIGTEQCDLLMTGRHFGDLVEAVTMRLARGSGIQGILSTLAPVTKLELNHRSRLLMYPLLSWRKEELEACVPYGVDVVRDPGNASTARGRVRELFGSKFPWEDWNELTKTLISVETIHERDLSHRMAVGVKLDKYGTMEVDDAVLKDCNDPVTQSLVASVTRQVSGRVHGPSAGSSTLNRGLKRIKEGGTDPVVFGGSIWRRGNDGGCWMVASELPRDQRLESAMVMESSPGGNSLVWRGRWRISSSADEGGTVVSGQDIVRTQQGLPSGLKPGQVPVWTRDALPVFTSDSGLDASPLKHPSGIQFQLLSGAGWKAPDGWEQSLRSCVVIETYR